MVRSVVVILASFALLFNGCREEDRRTNQAEVERQPQPAPQQKVEQKHEWADAGKAVRQGDLSVQLESVTVGKVKFQEPLREDGESDEDLLQVTVRLDNVGETRKIEYRSWAGRLDFFGRARVSDEFGNEYDRESFGLTASVPGQIIAESIYPGRSVTDVLIFERPVEKARMLRLELPASAFGGTGTLRFKIPLDEKSSWKP
ncbi:MAG: hypothetical protein KY476_15500 [Planctomycetes bacterium]|nr:hypothetical protein [Planctomycetota bacterium]